MWVCVGFKGCVGGSGTRPLCPSDISPTSGGNLSALPLLWMDVPSAEAPACAGMTVVLRERRVSYEGDFSSVIEYQFCRCSNVADNRVRASPASVAALARNPL